MLSKWKGLLAKLENNNCQFGLYIKVHETLFSMAILPHKLICNLWLLRVWIYYLDCSSWGNQLFAKIFSLIIDPQWCYGNFWTLTKKNDLRNWHCRPCSVIKTLIRSRKSRRKTKMKYKSISSSISSKCDKECQLFNCYFQ